MLAIFEVTLRCNSSCGYCNLPLNQGRYEMSRAEIARVFSHLYDEGIRIVFVQGGEPLLRKDLPDILEDLASIGFLICLITNGTKLSRAFVDRISRHPISISVSLDTLDPRRYRTIRGADQLPLVLQGIHHLQDYPHSKYLTCIVSEVNRDEAKDVTRFARNSGLIPVLGAYHWDIARYGKVDLTLQYKKSVASATFQEILKSDLIPKGYFREYLRDNIRWLDGHTLAPCDAGGYSIAIDSSGNVAPCLALPHRGNILESSLSQILDRLDYSEIQECSSRSSCNMLCSRVIGSILRHPLTAWQTPATLAPNKETASYAH